VRRKRSRVGADAFSGTRVRRIGYKSSAMRRSKAWRILAGRARFAVSALIVAVPWVSADAHAQILNIEKKRIDRPDKDFVVGNLGVNFAYTNRSPTQKEPVRVMTAGLTSNVAHFTDHNAYMLMSDYQLLRVNEGTVIDNGVTHLRVQIARARLLSYETFAQHQYDRARGLRFRGLFGSGARLRLFDTGAHSLIVGLGGMFERERWFHPTDDRVVEASFLKLNSYLSYRVEISKGSNLNAVVYYQIGHDDRVDLFRQRVSGEINLAVKIVGSFSLTSSFQGAYETAPLVPIVPLIFTTTSGVRLDF